MSHDHVGVPKFIENGFSNDGKVYCYNLKVDKSYYDSINKLGTKNNYYEDDVEKELLAQGVELQFSLFYNDFCGTTDPNQMSKILSSNINLVEQFFSFMFMRSIKTLDIINKNSLSSKLLGDLNHSELLRLHSKLQTNPFKMIGDNYRFYPLVNLTSIHLINNSVGFGLLINSNHEISFFIPLNIRVGILITNETTLKDSDFTYIGPNGTNKTDLLNKRICYAEKVIGNGFIFGDNKELVASYIDFIKQLKV